MLRKRGKGKEKKGKDREKQEKLTSVPKTLSHTLEVTLEFGRLDVSAVAREDGESRQRLTRNQGWALCSGVPCAKSFAS